MKSLTHTLAVILMTAGAIPASLAVELDGYTVRDAYVFGQLKTYLERELDWPGESYRLSVKDGVAVIELITAADNAQRSLPDTHQLGIDGLAGLQFKDDAGDTRKMAGNDPQPKLYSFLGMSENTEMFPVGDLFRPLIAHLKEPRFFASVREYDISDPAEGNLSVTVGAAGFGHTFGLYRRETDVPGNGIQLSIAAGVFSQFDLDASSFDLVNSDFMVGFPLTFRHNRHSARLQIYHQSSHLGDEYLLNHQPERINLSYESLELLYAYDWDHWRAYAGGEYLVNVNPEGIDRGVLHGGLEYRSGARGKRRGQWIAGLDLVSVENADWSTNWSFKAGYEFSPASNGQTLRLLGEYYDGHTPHGQFYDTKSEFFGLGLYFGY